MAAVAIERFVQDYFKTLHEAGLWMVVPFEGQGYPLDARHSRNYSVGRY